MNSFTPVIGIDFGTSNSKMAWYNPGTGQAEVLRNDEGEDETPSVVYFDKTQILVGTPAIEMLEDDQAWDRVILSVKRSMVKAPIIILPDRMVKPVEVAAEILRKLKHDAEELHFHQEVAHAVITCPASFDGLERDEIRKAGLRAGFSEVELLEEPLAAAQAYTELRTRTGFHVGKYVLIYDLGGGTFDLAILVREESAPFRIGMEPEGIKQCGGDDFDEALYKYCDKCAQENLKRSISLRGRDLHFLYECRKRKHNLSKLDRCTFSSLLSGGVRFRYEMTRATFEDLIRVRVEETVQKTKAMLARARTEGYEIDTFVLVGGSSQLPLVERLLKENLSLKVEKSQYRDVAVALGAAYYAHKKWNPDPGPKPTSVDDGEAQAERTRLAQYRGAVDAAWKDKKVDQTEVERLNRLATRLGLSKAQVSSIECEVMGDTKEAILARQLRAERKPASPPGIFTLTGTLTGHTGIVWSVAISPDGQLLASGSEDRSIRIWNLRTQELLRVLNGHAGGVYALAIGPGGQTLVSGSADGTIKMWNLYTGALLHTFTGQAGWPANVTSLAISPDGRLLAGGSSDRNIKFWNLSSGALLRPLAGHTDVVWSVAISSDGQLLASGSNDRTVKLWYLRTGMLIHNFIGHIGVVRSVTISPNGQLLASGGSDQTIKFWNLSSGAPLRPLVGHTGGIESMVFSPDGQLLISGSFDQTIRLWNLRTGTLASTLTGPIGGVHSIAITPNGQTLVSGSADTTIRIWRKS